MRIIALFNVGWKLLASALLDNTYNNMRNLLIGKFYSPADLAFYNQGSKIPCAIVDNINTSINSTLLPSLTSVQENQVDIKRITQCAIITSIYIMAPFMIGLSSVRNPLFISS